MVWKKMGWSAMTPLCKERAVESEQILNRTVDIYEELRTKTILRMLVIRVVRL